MNNHYSKTEKRRAIQPLLNCLAEEVVPHQEAGILLAVSGGPDSLALMESYAASPFRALDRVWVASLDHGQRPESTQEVERVKRRAKMLGFPVFTDRLWTKTARNEQTLRQWRYDRLTACAEERGLASIVTAHHADDDAEGFMLDLLGWGGGKGGSAMKNDGKTGEYRLLRPFLALSREQLRLALSALHVAQNAYIAPSDLRNTNSRAFVRHEILPQLSRYRPDVAARLAKRGQNKRADRFAENQLSSLLKPHPEGGYLIAYDQVDQVFLLQRLCKWP